MKKKVPIIILLVLTVMVLGACLYRQFFNAKESPKTQEMSGLGAGAPSPVSPKEVREGDVVFLGESQMGACDWSSLFGDESCRTLAFDGNDLRNETERVKLFPEGVSPRIFFLMFGERELLDGMVVGEIAEEYGQFVGLLKERFPATEVVLLSVLPMWRPTDNDFNLTMSVKVKNFNIFVKTIASRYDYSYVHLYGDFVTPEGTMNPIYSSWDGASLNESAYAVIKDRLKEFLNN